MKTSASPSAVKPNEGITTRRGAQGLRSTWVLGRRESAMLAASYVGLVIVATGLGLLLKGPLDDSVVLRLDRRIAAWFASHRTPNLNTYTMWGSDIADTVIKIAATAALALLLLLLWRRWLEPLVLVMSLALEAAVFITVTWLVRRPRPDVERLEGSPVDSGFPSGHTAAAAAYAALAVVVFWNTDRRAVRVAVATLSVVLTAVVGFARMYRGMHYLTDVAAGVALGAGAVAITAAVLSRSPNANPTTADGADVDRAARENGAAA